MIKYLLLVGTLVSALFLHLVYYYSINLMCCSLLVPDFEMQVSLEQSEKVRGSGGLVYYAEYEGRVCPAGIVVSSSDAGIFLPDEFSYSCGGDALLSCPNMNIDYESDGLVYVSGVYVLREGYHFDFIKRCAEQVISAVGLKSQYRDEKADNLASYGAL